MRGRSLALATASLLAFAGAAHAQTETQPADVEELVVTAQRLEESLPLELAEYGNRVQLIEAEAIEKRAVNDVAQVLQLLAPSLHIQPKAGAFDYVDISLQGSRTNEVLWLVDGVRITNRLYNGTTPLDTIPAAMVERIEVLEGGQGLFYGTQSVAGVVNVITKSLTKTGTSGQFSAGGDSNDGRHVAAHVRSHAGPHEFAVYASSDKSEGFQPIPTEDYQPSATDRKRGYDVQTYGAKYGIDFTQELRLSLGYQKTHAKLDFAQPNLIALYYNERDEDIVSAKIDWNRGDVFGLFLKSYYHKWDSRITRYNNVIGGTPGQTVQTANGTYWGYKDYGLNALAKFAPGNGMEFYAGYDFQNYNGRDDVLLIAEQTEQVHALFGQVRTTEDLFGNLKLAAGVRHNMPKSGDELTIWNASAQYDFSPNLFARTSLGTAYRLPDASELYSNDPCCEQGNPSLQGEKSTNVNASVGGYFEVGGERGSWEVVGFVRKVENLIAAVDNGAGLLVYENTSGETDVKGWMATSQIPLGPTFSASLTYSTTEATNASGLQIDRIPENTAKGVLDFHPEDLPIGGAVSFNYTGTTYQTLAGLGRLSFGDVVTADLSGYVEFGPDQRHRLTARVENLMDEVYTTRLQRIVPDAGGAAYAARFQGVPRTFHIRYSYDF